VLAGSLAYLPLFWCVSIAAFASGAASLRRGAASRTP
jgi:hypothetical protein